MATTALRFLGGLVVLLWLTGCVSAPQSDALLVRYSETRDDPVRAILSSHALLQQVPFFPQEDYQCGPAALATVLNASGIAVLPDALVSQVYVPARRGSLQIEMLAAARRYGRIALVLEPDLEALLQEVQAGRPVLVMQNLGLSWYPQWHYAVLVGFDLAQAKVRLRSGLIRDYEISLSLFERTWERADRWAVVLLAPGELGHDAREDAYFQSVSDFAAVADAQALALAYEAGLRRWPNSLNLAMARANLFYGEGKLDVARSAYQQVLEQTPDYAAAHNNLAQTLLEMGLVSLAKQHAERAVQIGGRFSATYQRTLDAIELADRP